MADQQQASDLLEQGQAKQASEIYQELGLQAHAAYAAIFDQDLERAAKLNKEAEYSPLSKWVEFLLGLLEASDDQRLASPGYLTCRLYTEASIGYLLDYQLDDYLTKLIKHRYDLVPVYPEILKDIGSAYLARKDYETALEYLNEAKQKYAQDAGVYYKSAIAYLGLDMPDQAKPCIEMVERLIPGSTLVSQLKQTLG
ncbi:MAG: tetratricopeptide repeat protein [Candidatus Melainabacteria bacterium]|nr:tetratricopeptide repeat protein [Candidatus Melainabacteria bacterium]